MGQLVVQRIPGLCGNKITKKEFLQHHGQHAIERRRKEKRKKKREAALMAKQERPEISRYWDPTFYNDNCQEKGKDDKRKTKKKKEQKKLIKHARSEPRVKFAHKVLSYLIFVIFFTLANFLENKIY